MRLQELVTIYQSALLSHCHTVSFSLGSSEHPSSCDSSLLQQKVQTQSATQSMGQTTSCKGFTSRSLFGTEFESKSNKSDQILYVRNVPISDSTTNKPVPGRPGGRGIWPRTRRPLAGSSFRVWHLPPPKLGRSLEKRMKSSCYPSVGL